MFESIFESSSSLSVTTALLCLLVSIVLGFVIALTHMKTGKYTKNFVVTLIILPALVQVVMLMVNGNLGTSVAVVGAFSLVRFRSIPGNSKEIASIFLAMAVGLSVGMGQILFAVLVTLVICLCMFILYITKFGERRNVTKILKITIPEDLDYTGVFDDIFDEYTESVNLEQVKTTNMGSMFELKYSVKFLSDINEKNFIDEIRCRNGNLNISLTNPIVENEL
jgi:hypothetical protein